MLGVPGTDFQINKFLPSIKSFQKFAKAISRKSDEISSHDFAEFNLVVNFEGRSENKKRVKKLRHVLPSEKRAKIIERKAETQTNEHINHSVCAGPSRALITSLPAQQRSHPVKINQVSS